MQSPWTRFWLHSNSVTPLCSESREAEAPRYVFAHRFACYHSLHALYNEVTRMAKQAVAHAMDVEPIDRLEEKIKLLMA